MPCSGPGFESWRRHPRKSFKNLQKSSKSEKIEVRETRGPVYRPSRLVYRTSVTFTAFFVLFTAFLSCLHDALRRSVCSFPLSGILKSYLEPLLCLFGLAGDSNLGLDVLSSAP